MAEQDIAALAERAISIAEQAAGTQAAITETQAAIVAKQDKIQGIQRKLGVIGHWLIVMVPLGILITVLGLVITFYLIDISGQLHREQAGQAALIAGQHRSQMAGCAVGNSFRAGQLIVWDHVISISMVPPHETAAQKAARLARLAGFRVFVGRQYRQIDCKSLYATKN
jgi:hypothetical protein